MQKPQPRLRRDFFYASINTFIVTEPPNSYKIKYGGPR